MPFTLRFTLSRRQRLAVELMPWLPAVAASLGFTVGAAYLAYSASAWFLLLLLVPPLVYRGLIVWLFDLIVRGGRPVEVRVSEADLEVSAGGERKRLALDGVFQVFREGDVWTVLHLDGTVLTVPADAISSEQVEYLKSFARRAAAARS